MDSSLDRVFAASLWAALSVLAGGFSVRLAFEWQARVTANDWPGRALRLSAAALGLGTAVWAMHVFSGPLEGPGGPQGYLPHLEGVIWLMAIGLAAAGFAWLGTASTNTWGWLPSAFGLATGIVALQMFGAWSVAASSAGPQWQLESLLTGWAYCLGSVGLAFGLWQRARGRDQRAPEWTNWALSLVAGAGIAASQHFTVTAVVWPPQPEMAMSWRLSSGVMLVLVLILCASVLTGLLLRVRGRLRVQAANAKARRALGSQLLTDPLTGLPNRPLFEGTLAQAVQRADAQEHTLALLYVNLDGFRPVNLSLGHRGGDRALCKVASRLRAMAGPHMVARVAGDEFLVLIPGNPSIETVSAFSAKLLASVGQPLELDDRGTAISCSIGVAMYPEHGGMSALIRHAEAAMRTAKTAGGAGHSFFESSMLTGSRDDVLLLRDLRHALARGELELYYQPKIHAPSGEITGVEALLRWNHPVRGMVFPSVFIPLAERYGLINGLGRWVIDEACRQAREWRDSGLRMRVAINLSVHQLRQVDLVDHLEEMLHRHQIKPDLITCELTESSAMDDTEVTMRVLGQLHQVGVHISIDDFGTGHSSLAYLRKLPADELKIDRSFVLDLETSEDARKVASAVINLAKSLDLKVVAEGVETEGQNRILREYGCDQLQGFLFAKPMSAHALAIWAIEDVGPRTMSFRSSLFKESVNIAPA